MSLKAVDFRFRMLAFHGACGEPGESYRELLLRLQEIPVEASFLVACLARRILR
jgi:hypothetical protein